MDSSSDAMALADGLVLVKTARWTALEIRFHRAFPVVIHRIALRYDSSNCWSDQRCPSHT